MRKIAACIVFVLLGLLSSCQDHEEFKIPTDVGFQVDMNRNASTNGRLIFNEGHIMLSSFSFDGRREEGGDIYFEKSYEQGLLITFHPDIMVEALQFKIPQGNYTRIKIALETQDSADVSAIVVTGSYLLSNGTRYPIRFEFSAALDLELESRDEAGNIQIVLKKGTPATATIKFDPVKWFEAVPASYLDNAELVMEEQEEGVEAGTPYMLISEESNEHIYELILSKLAQSAKIVFH